ncbi:MAG: hypothetical protein LBH43_04450 [Treponema sp.]|nr:hypothetical protein [Treponema sp.]
MRKIIFAPGWALILAAACRTAGSNDLSLSSSDYVIKNYRQDAALRVMARQLEKAGMFSQERRNVPVFCGEYSVNRLDVIQEDRVYWYEAASKLLDKRNIARACWDYYGSFGIFNFEKGRRSFFSDLNVAVLEAMGFSPPPANAGGMIS